AGLSGLRLGPAACARTLSGVRHERALVAPGDAERAVLVLLHAPRAVARVRGPRVLARAVVGYDDLRREAVVTRLLGLALPAGIGEARRRECEDADEKTN